MSFYMSDKTAKKYLIEKVEKYDSKQNITKKGSVCCGVISIALLSVVDPTMSGITLVGLSTATASILGITSQKYKNKEDYYKTLFEMYNNQEKQKTR